VEQVRTQAARSKELATTVQELQATMGQMMEMLEAQQRLAIEVANLQEKLAHQSLNGDSLLPDLQHLGSERNSNNRHAA
jgi:regulator of replication initiation timing